MFEMTLANCEKLLQIFLLGGGGVNTSSILLTGGRYVGLRKLELIRTLVER